jgi:murein DD-endopeptidase MepM/ murein hydrolase activator NlpD
MLNLLTLLLTPPPIAPPPSPAQAVPTPLPANAQEIANSLPLPVTEPESIAGLIGPTPIASSPAVEPSLQLSSQVTLPQWEASVQPSAPVLAPAAQAGAPLAPPTVPPTPSQSAQVTHPPTAATPAQDLAVRDRPVLESRLAQMGGPTPGSPADDFMARKRDRQAVLESRLAEIVARDRVAKNPQVQETQIAAAIDYANQGQFEQARQAVQAVPPKVRTNILRQIADLETAATQPTLVRGSAQARQILALSKVPRPRRLDQRVKAVSPTAGPDWRRLPPRSERTFASSVVNSTSPPNLAYNRLLAPNVLNNGDLRIVYPVPVPAPITSPFGWRVHPISGTRRFHSGTDIGADLGTPVLAAYSGRVKGADYMGGYGLAITIEHKNGTLDTLYGHLSKVAVRPGDWVEQGTMIGAVGSTGASTGPHLHFEIRKLASGGWATLDPGPQLKLAREQLIKVTNQARVGRSNNHG